MQRFFWRTNPISTLASQTKSHTKELMHRLRFIALLLALITLLAYLPVVHNGFLDYDDNVYITENRVVQHGLTWAGIKWAFTTWHADNWHPLTWLSHMLDCELFGLNAGAQHYINVLFHTANAVLLLLLLLRLTGVLWPSVFVAALFAWHPLHVESVAWIAERKDVLSTFFEMLALLAYVRFVAESKAHRIQGPKSKVFYILALLMFALGLMAKPMLVTLPFVLLLLDYWPLQRFSFFAFRFPLFLRLALEKWPFFLLAAASCIVTFLAQRAEAVLSLEKYPLNLRLDNALLSYVLYLEKAFWPTKLAVPYPLPSQLPLAEIVMAIIFLVVITWLVWNLRRPYPYLLAGWLWFWGTLGPVIGLVQVGEQAMADRYTYFPLIGIFTAIAFGIRDLVNRFQFPKAAVASVVALTLAGCLALTENQLRYWRDSESLFAHSLAVTKDNPIAHLNMGNVFLDEGKLNEALVEYHEAARLSPGFSLIHENLGRLLDQIGRPEEAMAEYRQALRLKSNVPRLHDVIGTLLVELGRFDEAMRQFDEAARLDPNYPWPHFQRGKALLKQGCDAEAIDELREALRIDPDNFQILAYTAYVLATDKKSEVRDGQTALMYAAKANALSDGIQPFVLDAVSVACANMDRFDDAREITKQAIEIAAAQGLTQNVVDMQQRLQFYQNHQPWRESFLFTNTPSKEIPKN
jgi:tetratricopeptide (TPR) repeat protein